MLYGFSAAMGCAAFRTLPGEMGGRLAAPPAVRRTLQQYVHRSLQNESQPVPVDSQRPPGTPAVASRMLESGWSDDLLHRSEQHPRCDCPLKYKFDQCPALTPLRARAWGQASAPRRPAPPSAWRPPAWAPRPASPRGPPRRPPWRQSPSAARSPSRLPAPQGLRILAQCVKTYSRPVERPCVTVSTLHPASQGHLFAQESAFSLEEAALPLTWRALAGVRLHGLQHCWAGGFRLHICHICGLPRADLHSTWTMGTLLYA
jgi:hypothetical protein